MNIEPEVQPLSRGHRKFVFIISLATFCAVVPLLVFYAMGYRIDIFSEDPNIRAVGGMYVSADADDVAIYIDDEPVEDMRIFQNAAYIQNLDAGLHQVHVQGDGVATWVKTLPVYAHFVTEAASFNMPVIPQIRLVTEYEVGTGVSVVSPEATSTFAFASTTNTLFATSSVATSSYVINPEFVYLDTLFASSSEERTFRKMLEEEQSQPFQFAPTGSTTSHSLVPAEELLLSQNDVTLQEIDGEVVVTWAGNSDRVPYHFCVTYAGPDATSLAYGEHVYEDVLLELSSTTNLYDKGLIGSQLCRSSIRIDNKNQSVKYFDFVPGSSHLVLMQLEDGVYVVEVDDRAWQNTQLLYPGEELEVLVDSGSIFIKDGKYIIEVFTELQT